MINTDFGAFLASFLFVIIIIAIIELILKGFAMWRAAERKSKGWFWVLLLINTAGILPLIYLLATNEKKVKKRRK